VRFLNIDPPSGCSLGIGRRRHNVQSGRRNHRSAHNRRVQGLGLKISIEQEQGPGAEVESEPEQLEPEPEPEPERMELELEQIVGLELEPGMAGILSSERQLARG
jgi:hypothetical protein